MKHYTLKINLVAADPAFGTSDLVHTFMSPFVHALVEKLRAATIQLTASSFNVDEQFEADRFHMADADNIDQFVETIKGEGAVWNHEIQAYKFKDGSYGRIEQTYRGLRFIAGANSFIR